MKTQYKVVGEPTLYQLQMINSRTHTNYKQEDLYVFEFTLCNDQLDYCFRKFNVDALDQIRDKCIGSTGYIDIPNDINTYTARIFEAITYITKKCCYVTAFAYIFRNKVSQKAIDFIEELMSKQTDNVSISISCNRNKHICNICNVNIVDSKCRHIPGKVYDGVRCERTIYDITDFYEWSITEKVTQNKTNDKDAVENNKDTVEPYTEISESKQHVIDELIGIVDKNWNNFKINKDSKYLYSTLKFIEMLQETV